MSARRGSARCGAHAGLVAESPAAFSHDSFEWATRTKRPYRRLDESISETLVLEDQTPDVTNHRWVRCEETARCEHHKVLVVADTENLVENFCVLNALSAFAFRPHAGPAVQVAGSRTR